MTKKFRLLPRVDTEERNRGTFGEPDYEEVVVSTYFAEIQDSGGVWHLVSRQGAPPSFADAVAQLPPGVAPAVPTESLDAALDLAELIQAERAISGLRQAIEPSGNWTAAQKQALDAQITAIRDEVKSRLS